MAFFQYSPLYFWCRLQVVFPYVCGQGGVIFLANCPEAVGVVIEPSFEGQVSYSHILHFTATRAYVRLVLCPLSFNALSYSCFASLNTFSLHEIELSLLLTEIGTCLSTYFGWLDWVLMYNILSLGFLYGW